MTCYTKAEGKQRESRGAFCCACSVNFSLIRKPLVCACVGFPLENRKRKGAVKYQNKKGQKENKDNASARDMVAPSGQKWRNNYGFIRVRKSFQSLV